MSNSIEAVGLTRRFGDVAAVSGLDLAVGSGEIYGFLGPNGAGKTTTIRMLCGMLRPSSGSVRIAGIELAEDPQAVRRVIGFVPDTPPLYDYLSGREYIAFVASLYGVPRRDRDARSAEFLDAFGLSGRADELCKAYSHGMKKKLHLAAVLTTQPRVLFLDEPTNGLDPASTRRLKDVLLRVCEQGVTVFLSTHVLDVASEVCGRVGILFEGRLRAEGPCAELQESGDRSLEDVFLRLTAGEEASHVEE